MNTIVGTCHFQSFNSAWLYYKDQGLYPTPTAADITDKIYRQEIKIGRPKLKENQSLFIKEGRNHICE